MRILYLTNSFPYPLTSGYLRHYFFIRGLAERHEVTLLSIVGHRFCEEHRRALAPFTTRVMTFGSPERPSIPRRVVTAAFRAFPGGDRTVEALRAAVARCLREEHFDIVLFTGKRNYPVMAALRDIPVIVDIC